MKYNFCDSCNHLIKGYVEFEQHTGFIITSEYHDCEHKYWDRWCEPKVWYLVGEIPKSNEINEIISWEEPRGTQTKFPHYEIRILRPKKCIHYEL